MFTVIRSEDCINLLPKAANTSNIFNFRRLNIKKLPILTFSVTFFDFLPLENVHAEERIDIKKKRQEKSKEVINRIYSKRPPPEKRWYFNSGKGCYKSRFQ